MDIYESYKILGVSTTAEIEEITKAFKLLAKKFHPDANPDKLDWAHKKMSDLNQAYQVIVDYKKGKSTSSSRPGPSLTEYLKNLFKKEGYTFTGNFNKKHPDAKNQKQAQDKTSYYDNHPSYEDVKKAAENRQNIISKVSREFKLKKDFIDEAMFVYYQYKLYKRPLRKEGVGRLKFGDVRRNLKRGLMAIDKIYKSCPLDDLKEELKLYIDFVDKFVKSIDCKDYISSYNDIRNVEAYRYYRDGSDKLDKAFRNVFFETKTTKNIFREVNIANLLSLAMENFIFIGEQYNQSNFAADASIKADLLDYFYRLYIKKYFK
jgi:curved DNA-binding protein CbpA